LAAAAAAVAGAPALASAPGGGACAAQTAATLAGVDTMVTTNIYRGELAGAETTTDLGYVETAPDLLAAVEADNPVATLAAVKRIVYHPFWHIVRLRVLDASGRVLADFGGPYVIAPVSGTLRNAAGAQIASFVMSVQDDVGFTKLENRALGYPIGIYLGGTLVAQLGASFPKHAPSGTSVTLAGQRYATQALSFNAFPAGTLQAVIALPAPTAAQLAESCQAVTVGEIGRVAQRLALRFHPLVANYPNFVEVVHSETGALVVVRIGLRAIAGTAGPGAVPLPTSGSVTYNGRVWTVFSFAPTPPARVYLLVATG
jgi:hypothetical protein